MSLQECLTSALWEGIARKTRNFLLIAEELFDAAEERGLDDYGAVGLLYRQAIEGEWKGRLLPIIGQARKGNYGRLRGMITWLERSLTPRDREQLGVLLGSDSPLFDKRFLARAQQVFEQLNSAAHSGMTRDGGVALRNELIQGAMLRQLLAAVHPRNPVG